MDQKKMWSALWQGDAVNTAAHRGSVIFLEGCHRSSVLIDTPCPTPEALDPDSATQVT